MYRKRAGQAGFTLVELSISMVLISIVAISFFGLFITLVNSATSAKRRAVALTIANNQMEYLKSLPYDNLIVIGGSIVGTGTIPASSVKRVNNVPYTVKTSINYVDDAFDGCGNIYSAAFPKLQYCRNSVSSTPTTDSNFQDYKVAHVSVLTSSGVQLASVDTQISARVSETASNTGALVVTVLDGSGAPLSGATVTVVNSTVTPNVNASDTTDANGVSLIYGAPPDAGNDYIVTASKSGYSSLTTIAASGSLQPTYPNLKILTQQSSAVTLTLYPMSANSLVAETTDVTGSPLAGVKVYAKGGYKKYTATTDTSYYFDNMSGSDTRPTTDSSGLAAFSGLAPANGYIFCGDLGDTNCKVGATTYYLAAAVPYGGTSSLQPITLPPYDASNPPAITYTYNGTNYLQKVRLMLTTNANFPRVFTMNPYQLSLASAGNISSFLITLTGSNLSSATAKLVQGGTTYAGSSCSNTATQLKCSFNLTGITAGTAQVSVTNAAGTLTLPVTPLGGFNVNP